MDYTRNNVNLIHTPAGKPVNFIPNTVVSVATTASTTFGAGILYCGTGGAVAVVPSGQTNAVTFVNIPDGSFLPVYINALVSQTAADGLLMCY
jgi:hypothetical protein